MTGWQVPFISGKREFLLNRPSDFDYWRGVADYMKGRQNPFLLPTFRNDLPVINEPALSATVFVSSNVQFFKFWRQRTYSYIRIQTNNGVIYRKVKEVTVNYDGDGNPLSVNVILSSALGAVAGDNIIKLVSFMNICRLDNDEIVLNHGDLQSVLSFDITTVNE